MEFSEALSLGEHAVLVVQPNSDGTANVVAVLAEANDPVIEALYKCIAREALKAKALEETRAKEAAVNKPVGKKPAANADQQRLAA